MPQAGEDRRESCCWCCSHCCIVYSVCGIVLMTWFGFLIKNKSITFLIESAKHDHPWDFDAKATACFVAAGLYAVTLVVALASRQAIASMRAKRV